MSNARTMPKGRPTSGQPVSHTAFRRMSKPGARKRRNRRVRLVRAAAKRRAVVHPTD